MLTDEQVAGVINFVRTHFGNHYTDSITAAEVTAMHPPSASH
jgi:mono/diheme cytochrome c family protein